MYILCISNIGDILIMKMKTQVNQTATPQDTISSSALPQDVISS